MHPSDLFFRLFTFLLPPALLGTAYLYFYPVLQDCSFPQARHAEAACYFGDHVKAAVPGERAPFRLLALADPQLEGDTSIPKLRTGDAWDRVGSLMRRYRKKLDLWGNDLFLAHVYRSVKWWSDPTHVVVLGDLLGSQWIGDDEFQRRSERFWGTVFAGAEKVPSEVTDTSGRAPEILGRDKKWRDRIIAVAGNHDVGYAGDLDVARVERFEKAFGRVNWEVSFALNESPAKDGRSLKGMFGAASPELRLIILNSMNLDHPARDEEIQHETRGFMTERFYYDIPSSDTGTVLLTHIPLYKTSGVCEDGPFFDYYPKNLGGAIKEQNHLSYAMSELVLDGMVGLERTRKGIVLDGHDHAGCEIYHSKEKTVDTEAILNDPTYKPAEWEAIPYAKAAQRALNASLAGVREVTVRSMMGSYSGNAGMLSAWWDREAKEWKFDYSSCAVGIQHIWWAVHVLDLIVLGLGLAGMVSVVLEIRQEDRRGGALTGEEKRKKKA